MKQIATALLIPLILISCAEQGAAWSDSEKENAQHFFYSLESSIAANTLSNEIARGRQSKTRMQEVVALRRTALKEARLVQDSVLRKANEELPEKFRDLYQKSLEYFIQAYEDRDNQASMRYSVLADQWGSWYNQNKRAIRIPK